jgi:hypothetical protein
LVVLSVGQEVVALALGRHPGADDPDAVLMLLGPNNENNAACDGPDGDEPLLFVRMSIVEEFEVSTPEVSSVDASSKETPCLLRFARFFASSHVNRKGAA